ncbi:MAG: hypothetical protein ACXWFI_13060 [Methylobacter sp.]
MIIQTQKKKKVFKAFELVKVKNFTPLNSPEAWLALLKLSTPLKETPKANSL